ncbi:PAS domain S-box [Allocoleopsis franciscana PCC 7113]|uniref:histidine kinase n=2 Tax=Allocoleopsis TaxID=2886347 RepID=K9WDQ0_9CYAN|nr:PAS domain S-box [Allocoleopsis franciscana PCC 7113]
MQSCNSDLNHSLAHMTESMSDNTDNEWTLKKKQELISTNLNQANSWSKQPAQQDQWTQLLAKITLKIRQSLQLEDILQTTVTEVRELLEADRVLIYRLWPDGTGSGVTEAIVPGWSTVLGQVFEAEVFPQEYHQLYASGRILAIKNVEDAEISPCMVEFLQQFEVKSKLVVPILLKEKLWGLLVAHQCAHPRQWLRGEIELLQQLADQVSIALSQAQYQEHLEELVAQRTAKLTKTLEQLQQEINERQRTEKALRESEERWRSLVKNAPDLIFTCDRTGKILYINRTVPGFTLEQAIGSSVYDYIPDESKPLLKQSFERVFQTGEAVYYETQGSGAYGTTSWYASRVGPIQQEGEVIAAMVISTDITERKQAEELLHLREQEFRALVEHSPDLIVRFDPQLRHLYVNPAVERSTGIPRQTFIGKTNQELGMPQELVAGWNKVLLEVLATGQEGMIEFDFPTASGLKSYQTRIIPEFAQDGTIRFLLGVTHDITPAKQAEKALQQRLLREQALHQLVQSIRNSLDLETIFFTAVAEIGKLLPVDRALVVQYLPDRKLWLNVADYRASSDLPVALGLEIPDEDNCIAARLKQSQLVLMDHTNQCEDEINRHFSPTFPGAGLWVPLYLGSQLWGSLSLFVENHAYAWQDSEVQLTLAVAEQLAIAIQQAELLNQSQIATVKAQEQAEALKHEIKERKRTEETLRAIYKVSTARKLSFEQRLQGLLALGRRRFGLEIGALGRVKNNVYEVIAAQVAPKSSFPITKGTIWNLEQTYCSVTLGTKEPIAFASAGTSSWRHLPAYTSRPVEAYLGMSVVVAGQIYGSLSFFSLHAHQHPFTAGDKALLKLMAQWVGALLEHQLSEEELRQSEARFRAIAQREALLNQLASQIRRSLDLNTILETAVHEIQNLLKIDRCFFLWYRAHETQPVWEVVTEARSPAFPSVIGHCVPLSTFGPLTRRVFNKEITRVDNARSLTDPAERKFFFSLGYTAMLALPIHTTSGEIGVVSCGHSTGSRPWRQEEVELLEAVADQMAIAIDQAELLHQSRTTAAAAQEQATQLKQALNELQQTQAQLVQSEKMSSLGQLVAGIAHEINNPVNFIYGNLTYVSEYAEDLLHLIQLYQEYCPRPAPVIETAAANLDLDFMKEDFPKIVSSMKGGADRIRQIVLSLRNFSRVDEAEMKWVDIHEGIDNSLLILAHRLKAQRPEESDIQIIKDYNNLPKVQCYAGQLNQVFMNILANAIDAIASRNACEALGQVNPPCSPELFKSHPGLIWICTEVIAERNEVMILISDNGPGMTQEVQRRIFDPFFTTKPVGSGTGLGLSISYQIVVEKHGGRLECISAPGQGTVFLISLPIRQSS